MRSHFLNTPLGETAKTVHSLRLIVSPLEELDLCSASSGGSVASTAVPMASPRSTPATSPLSTPRESSSEELPAVGPVVNTRLMAAIRSWWPRLLVASSFTGCEEYAELLREGGALKIEVIAKDVQRSRYWTKATQAGSRVTWPLPPLEEEHLAALQRILVALAGRAEREIRQGSRRVTARYIQGWNYLARLLLFASGFDELQAFRVLEGLMLHYQFGGLLDPCSREFDKFWHCVFNQYDAYWGARLGAFSVCQSAQRDFSLMFGTALQTSGFTCGLPPLTAVRALAFVVEAGEQGARSRFEELMVGCVARLVRMSGIKPQDLDDEVCEIAAEKAVSIARGNLVQAMESCGEGVVGQILLARQLRQLSAVEQVAEDVKRLLLGNRAFA